MPDTEAPETPSLLSGKHSPARTDRLMRAAGRGLRITLVLSATLMTAACGEDSSSPFTPEPEPSSPAPPPSRDDHGNNRGSATRVNVPSDTSGTLTVGDSDFFRVEVSRPGRLQAYTTGDTDTVGRLYDANSELWVDDNSGAHTNFRIDRVVASGTYYIEVWLPSDAAPGSYAVHVRFTELADDHGDDRASATRVAAPSDTDGLLTPGDADYFRFEVRGSVNLFVYSSGGTGTVGRLEDGTGAVLAEDEGNINFRIRRDVSSGTYYVRVTGSSPSTIGSYTLHVILNELPGQGDDHGDDRGSATRVGMPSDTSGRLTAGDTDYFRISVSDSGTLEVYTSGSVDTVGQLEDSGGSRLTGNDDGGSGRNFRIERDVSGGTYYIRVRGIANSTTGNYRLHVRFEEDSFDDHGDSRSDATRIDVPSDTSGRLTAGDTDYFRISVSDSGTLEVYTSGSVDTVGQLEDSGGSRLTGNDDGGSGGNFRIERDVSGGTYYIRVRGIANSATGNYRLHVRFEEDSFDDHGDSRSDATRIDVPSDTSGRLTAGDTDYFRISVSDSGTLEVYTSGSVDTVGQLEDSGGSRLTGNDDGGSGGNFRIERDVSGGTYYIRVRGIANSATGNYRLHVRFEEDSFDDHGDSQSDATRIDVPSDTSGRLTAGDTDYFRISVSDSGTLEVYTSGSVDTVGQLEDSGGSRLARNDDGSGRNFRIERDVSSGTYYIRVTGYSSSTAGNYRLHVRFVGDEYPPRLAGVYWEVTTPPDFFISESEVRCGRDGVGRPGPGVYISWDLYPEAEYFDLHSRSRDDRDPDWQDVGALDGEGFLVDPNREEVCYERWGFGSPIRVDLRLRAVLYDGSMSEWHTILNIPLPANPLAAAKGAGIEESEGVGIRDRAGRPRR